MYNLVDEILKAGVDNVLFIVPMRPVRTALGLISYTSSEDELVKVPATIVQDRYKLEANYKIELRPTYDSFGKESFYVTDLTSLLRKGYIQMFIKSIKFRKE